jgi:hypothetical protein
MNNATSEQLEKLTEDENRELRRFCTLYGVQQSNLMFDLLTAKDKDAMFEVIRELTTDIIKNERGGAKCTPPQVWDKALQACV